MRIQHTSDNHGFFQDLEGDFDVVIHSGDLFPNHCFGPKRVWSTLEVEKAFQTDWLKGRIETIKEWIKGKPFLFCSGNHDFIDPCPILIAAGITAINLDDKVTEFEGHTLYGLPWVPFIEGVWNFELMDVEMREEIDRMLNNLRHRNARPDGQPAGWETSSSPMRSTIHLNSYRNYCFAAIFIPDMALTRSMVARLVMGLWGICLSGGSLFHRESWRYDQ
jgi:hypothetical protein